MAIKALGVVRKLDPLGRIVVPSNIRKELNWQPDDGIEMFANGRQVILRKYEPFCTMCGNSESLVEHEGIRICKKCVQVLADKAL